MKLETRYNQYLAMAGPLRIRPPTQGDAVAIRTLIKESPLLDTNSCYAYLLQAWHFSDTCALAEVDGKPVAYVSAYLPPGQPETLFIWQIVVADDYRGKGLAYRLIRELLLRAACSDVRFISATVAVGNIGSERFFKNVAREIGCDLGIKPLMASSLFGLAGHPSERLFCLGPIERKNMEWPDRREHDYESECI